MAEDKEKRIPVRVAEELHRPVRIRLAELDASFQDVLTALLRGWVTGELTLPGAVPAGGYGFTTLHIPVGMEAPLRHFAEWAALEYRRLGGDGIRKVVENLSTISIGTTHKQGDTRSTQKSLDLTPLAALPTEVQRALLDLAETLGASSRGNPSSGLSHPNVAETAAQLAKFREL